MQVIDSLLASKSKKNVPTYINFYINVSKISSSGKINIGMNKIVLISQVF